MVAAYHKKLNEKMAWKKRERHNAFALYCDSTCCMSMFKMTKLSTQKMRRERALKSYCTAHVSKASIRAVEYTFESCADMTCGTWKMICLTTLNSVKMVLIL